MKKQSSTPDVLIFLAVWLLITPALFAQTPLTREERILKRELDDASIVLGRQAMRHDPSLELAVGDTVPDALLRMVGYPRQFLRLNDTRGTFLIISFWNTYCSNCLEAFERLAPIEEKYRDRLLVLPVTFEGWESIRWFYDRRASTGKRMPFPSAVQDTLLRKFFPHYGDPHEVWIDDRGVVKAVTGHHGLTEANILRFLNGESVPSDERFYPYIPHAVMELH